MFYKISNLETVPFGFHVLFLCSPFSVHSSLKLMSSSGALHQVSFRQTPFSCTSFYDSDGRHTDSAVMKMVKDQYLDI